MCENGLYLVFLQVLDGGASIVASVGLLLLELFKVLDIVDVVGDLYTSTRDADLVSGTATLLLLLWPGAILRVRVRIVGRTHGS